MLEFNRQGRKTTICSSLLFRWQLKRYHCESDIQLNRGSHEITFTIPFQSKYWLQNTAINYLFRFACYNFNLIASWWILNNKNTEFYFKSDLFIDFWMLLHRYFSNLSSQSVHVLLNININLNNFDYKYYAKMQADNKLAIFPLLIV